MATQSDLGRKIIGTKNSARGPMWRDLSYRATSIPQQELDALQHLIAAPPTACSRKQSPLRDVFVWACERSAAQYASVRQTLGEPDPFRLRHHAAIAELVASIVRRRIPQDQAPSVIRKHLPLIPAAEQQRFQATVEAELLSLHEGLAGSMALKTDDSGSRCFRNPLLFDAARQG